MASYDHVDANMLRKVVKLLTEGKSVADVFVDATISGITLEQIKEIESILISEAKNPLVRLEDAGKASILSYNLPTSSSYKGFRYIVMSRPELAEPNYDWFKDETKK